MKEIIWKRMTKLGEVTITRYEENGEAQYKVKLDHPCFGASWYNNRRDAMAEAQFLAGKY